ncbi:hypothetical protein Tco_1319179 [Tanacetum coccineum]
MPILHSFEENKIEYEDEDEVAIKMMGTRMDKESLEHNIYKNDITSTLGWHLKEIHVTWAHLEKKPTRLRLYTIYLEELCIQSMETVSQTSSDDVRIFKTFDWDEEEVSDDEEMTQVKVLMALVDDDLAVGKNHDRNGEWIDIIMRKVNILLSMDKDADWQNYLKEILQALRSCHWLIKNTPKERPGSGHVTVSSTELVITSVPT